MELRTFVVVALLMAGAATSNAPADAARERRESKPATETRPNPKIVTNDGHLHFQSATNHNITFEMSGNSDVLLGTTSMNDLVDQVKALQQTVDQLKKEGTATCKYVVCQNGGSCMITDGVPLCHCPSPWFGQSCQIQMPSVCSYNITRGSGVLHSVGYPVTYPASAECTWRLQTKAGMTFRIMFSGFGLEQSTDCSNDALTIYDGLSKGDFTLARLCGASPPSEILSTTNEVLIMLQTDSKVQMGPGFSLSYFPGPPSLCGGELTEDSGDLTSPEYPLVYGQPVTCVWKITIPAGETLSFVVNSITLSGNGRKCETNKLDVYDGPNELSPIFGSYCQATNQTHVSTGHEMYIKYVSDGTGTLFKATYETRCGGVLNSNQGTIKSPFFPGFYPHKKRCVWSIKSDPGTVITASFIHFEIEPSANCIYDYVAFINGPTIGSGPLINQTCGSRPPLPITSSMNDLTIVFRTDGADTFRGFQLRYVSAPGGCGGSIKGQSGVISSPAALTAYDHSVRCIWTMEAHVPTNVIQLTFTSFNLEPELRCRYDFIRLHDGASIDSPVLHNNSFSLGRFCGSFPPPMTFSSAESLTLAFYSDISVAGDGFSARWQSTTSRSCSHTFTADSGSVESPNYPASYPHSVDCYYTIRVTTGLQIVLNFSTFSLERHSTCNFDRLTIYDGSNNVTSPLLGTFCGVNNPGRLISSGSSLLFVFHTDSSGSAPGFRAKYTTASGVCGGSLHAPSGIIRSPNYPQPYPVQAQCDWVITTLPGNTITVTVNDLDVEASTDCFFDYLEMRDGGSSSSNQLTRLCSTVAPSQGIMSTGNTMFIRFQSDLSMTGRGFELQYTSGCGGSLTALSGTIMSPNYPQAYPDNRVCNWTITGNPGDIIIMRFVAFGIEPSPTCSFDYLAVHNGSSAAAPLAQRLCGYTLPSPIVSANSLFLSFVSDVSLPDRGFMAVYAIEGCSADLTGPHGRFSTPNYPNNYFTSRVCAWKITLPVGQRVSLNFTEIDLENHPNCLFDRVTIYNGPDTSAPAMAQYCSRHSPISLTSASNEVLVVFQSDVSNTATGFSVTYTSEAGGCGGSFTAPSGYITSPLYPGNYPHNTQCTWTITVPAGHRVDATFLSFDLEQSATCSYDYVQLFDRVDSDAASLLRACGPNVTQTVQSSSNVMVVKFRSDQSGSHTGFRLFFETGCGGIVNVTDVEGVITSPFYPHDYPHNTDCSWLLSAPLGKQVTLTFTNLNTENSPNCTFDAVEVYAGDSALAPLLGLYCGNHIPPHLTSAGNNIFIRFRSDGTSTGTGFRLIHTSSVGVCGGTFSSQSGSFNSPSYPGRTPANADCVWRLTTNAGSAMQLSFASFNVLDSSPCPNSYLQVHDGQSQTDSVAVPRTCGSVPPSTVTSSQSDLLVRFVGGGLSSPGFQASYTTVCDRTLTASQGFIESPNYPGDYPHLHSCTWIISAPPGMVISLTFLSMDMEDHFSCAFDYVQVRDGNTDTSILLGQYCGTTVPAPIVSSGSLLFIRFRSDFSSRGSGFRMQYSSQQSQCRQDLTATSSLAYFTSPNYPRNYSNNANCEWVITAPGTHVVRMELLDFELERPFFFCFADSLEIRNGPSSLSPMMASLCGTSPQPSVFFSTGPSLYLRFRTDAMERYRGFRASYVLACGGALTNSFGRIIAPTVNNSYSANLSCVWTISVPAGHSINLQFEYFDIELSSRCANDFLEIRSGTNETSPLLNQTSCGQRGPFNVTVQGHQARLMFVSNAIIHGRGFSLNYSLTYIPPCNLDLTLSDVTLVEPLTSPNYPGNYPSNVNCFWRLNVPADKTIRLIVTDIDIEPHSICQFDSLTIYDGGSDDGVPLLTLCGRSLANVIPLVSSTNQMFVRFRSDSSVAHKGFRLQWGIGCGGTYSTSSGLITSPNYPNQYSANLDCQYHIALPTNKQIQLNFNQFSLQTATPCRDYIKIYDGSSRNASLLQTLCSSALPQPMQSTGNRLMIEFHSDASVQGNGFEIIYATAGQPCGGRLVTTSGTISSPNYPAQYPNRRVCQWVISVGIARSIELTSNAFAIQSSFNCTKDYVEIRGGETDDSPLLGRFCGSNPIKVNSSGNHMFVKFFSNGDSILGDGFSLSYTSSHVGCGGNFVGESGNITSPNYPNSYPGGAVCDYVITVPSGTVAVKFNDFVLERSSTCRFDYVELRNGPTELDHRAALLCGTTGNGFNYTTVHKTIFIRFVSDSFLSYRGFHLSWSNRAFGSAQCGGVVSGSATSLQSPGYPVAYPNNVDCAWLVTVPAGRVIVARPVDVAIEASPNCVNDYVAIYNGDSTAAPLIIRTCDTHTFLPTFTSSGRSLYVVFHSDGANTGRGARAVFSASIPGCGRVLTEDSGYLTSPGFPANYPVSSECDWTIRVTGNQRINIFIDTINIEAHPNCLWDSLEFFDGPDRSSPSLGKFCGTAPPAPIMSSGSVVYVLLVTDASAQRSGFNLTYTTGCGGLVRSPSGVIVSPNYPSTYPINSNCNWNIDLPANKRVVLSYSNFDLPGPESNGVCSQDYIQHATSPGNVSIASPQRMCGTSIPAEVTSISNKLDLTFISDGVASSNTGFRGTFRSVCGGEFGGQGGTIVSHTVGGAYLHHEDCTYIVRAPPGNRVSYKFSSFRLESHTLCAFDYVEIRDGDNAQAPLIGKFCGLTVPPRHTATSATLYIRFVSDLSIASEGFTLEYSTAVPPCGGRLIASTGMIQSTNFPQNYPSNDACTWVIMAPFGMKIKITFSAFALEAGGACLFDFLEIRDGPYPISPLITRQCGSILPANVTTAGNIAYLQFTSDFVTEMSGFKLTYQSVQGCGSALSATNVPQLLTSPQYPGNFQANTNCEWVLSSPPDTRISLVFNDFALPPRDANTRCTSAAFDISDTFFMPNTPVISHCGAGPIPTYLSDINYLRLRMRSSDIVTKGFSLSYQIVNCSQELTNVLSGTLTSPNYPHRYPIPSSCITTLTAPIGHTITVFSKSIDMPSSTNCALSFILFRDGATIDDPLLGNRTWCGTVAPPTLTTTGNVLYMAFVVREFTRGNGYLASYITSPQGRSCGGALTGNEGALTTPNYPDPYAFAHDCEWTINVDAGKKIEVTFEHFHVEASPTGCLNTSPDYLQLNDGVDSSGSLVGRFCGFHLPAPYVSSSNNLYLRFKSDILNNNFSGFKLHFKAV